MLSLISFLIADLSYGQTTVNIKPVAGVGYAVDWVRISYRDVNGRTQTVRHESNIPLGQEANLTVPANATNIRMTAKQLGSIGSSRIFNNYPLASNRRYCFELTGALYNPRHRAVDCGWWRPRGRIVVFDDRDETNIPLDGVKIVVKDERGRTLWGSFTNRDGRFTMPREVRGKVKYQVLFEDREGMKVVHLANQHAESVTFQPTTRALSHEFTTSNRKHWYRATVYNAGRYYKRYAAQDNLPYKRDVRISVLDINGRAYAPATGVQDIVLYGKNKNSYENFSTTMHELAHITHSRIDRGEYTAFALARTANRKWESAHGESFACGPEAIYTNRRYHTSRSELLAHQNRDLSNFTYAHWGSGEYLYIAPLVVDLMDNCNQRNRNCYSGSSRRNNELPVDRVSGYTLRQIAYALRGAGNMDEWKTNLARISNPTNRYLDEYFNQYYEERSTRTGSNTIISIKPVAGVGYAVDWIKVYYEDEHGNDQKIEYHNNVPLGEEALITVPSGADNIRIYAKPVWSLSRTRIFSNYRLAAGQRHCFHLTGTVNSPRYRRVNCETSI